MVEKETPKDVQVAEKMAEAAEYLYETKDEKFSWKEFKKSLQDKAMRFSGALVMEKNKQGEWVISIGRVSWWLAFVPALYIFIVAFAATTNVTEASEIVARDITPNHLTILLTLAGYNFGKKIADTVQGVWGKGDGPG